MVNREEIDGMLFIAQTTYYVYRNEEDLMADNEPFLTTSNTDAFEACKNRAKEGKLNINNNQNGKD